MNRVTMLSLALAAAALPFESRAVTAQAGLEACTEALVQSMASEQPVKPAFRIDGQSTIGSRMPGHGLWHLDARDPVSDRIVARVDCRVDRQARVTELMTLPLTAADAEARAR